MKIHKTPPIDIRVASFDDFMLNGVKRIGMVYYIRSYHTGNYEEYVVHELLHVKNPDWSEEQVNIETEEQLKFKL